MNIDFEKDIEIDCDALDIEWLEQPRLALKYCQYVAKLRGKVNRLQENKKTKRSELILQVNQSPKELLNKEKPNAGDIEAHYRNHPEYRRIIEQLLLAEEELEYAEGAKNEICFTRKAALENLVQLHGQMYFAGPKVPRNLKKEVDEKRSNAKITMRRKK